MERYDATTYGDRIAEVYDSWYGEGQRDPADAVEFLAELAEGGRALELGVGTGRIAIPLAGRDVDLVGIDASEAMVAKLRAKPGGERVEVVMGDFADVAVEGEFDLIYVPFTTFFALDSQDRQIQCLRNLARHLRGSFVMDAFVPLPGRFGPTNQATNTVDSGLDYVVLDAMRHDPMTQIVEGHHVLITESGTRLFPVRLRYCWPSELDAMALVAGLGTEGPLRRLRPTSL
jgi:SAM-dependent methyltransferase